MLPIMMNKKSYSASELVNMKLPYLPTTKKGWLDLVKRENWCSVMAPGGRGCKGGMRREYYPSEAVAYLIESTQNSDEKAKHADSLEQYPVSTTEPLVTGSGQHNGLTLKSHSITDMRVNDYAIVPKNDLRSTTEGHDRVIHSEQIVDHLAFKKKWLEMSLNTNSNCLALISVRDDSMEPTLRSDDLILTDTSSSNIENNSIYVLQIDNELIVKRIQRKVNGTVIVKSDNPVYGEEEMDALAAKSLPVVGKVVWFGRRM